MNKFVKIDGYENWFLVVEKENQIPPRNVLKNMHNKLRGMVASEKLKVTNQTFARLQLIDQNPMGAEHYASMLTKYKRTLLLRENGSFMYLDEAYEITDTFHSESFDFPVDGEGEFEIVVCENDFEGDESWMEYLTKRFPHLKIRIINLFRHRTIDEIKKMMAGAKYVTFYTTFSNLDWVEKMAECVEPTKQKIIGYSLDKSKWKSALQILKKFKVEIIKMVEV